MFQSYFNIKVYNLGLREFSLRYDKMIAIKNGGIRRYHQIVNVLIN